MKTKLSLILLVCTLAFANSYAANRYWVGGSSGTWATTTSWSETSGGASGATAPTTGDDVFFNSGNPTVAVGANITVNSITFSSSNVILNGGFTLTITTMTVDNSQVSIQNNVEIVSALTFSGTAPTIKHSGLNSSNIYKFQLGTGGAFALIGNSITNYFDTSGSSSFRYNTTTDLTVYFKPTTTSTIAGINVDKGLITIGNSITAVRLNFPVASLNNQELILAPGVTFILNSGGSSTFTELANGGTVNASASGSKFVIKSNTTGVLDGTKRIFKTNTVINNLEFNSATYTFNLFEPIKVRTLTLTAGTINNSTYGITIEAGGSVVTVAGTTTASVITGTPSTRYWVGGLAGNWSNPASWGTASGSTSTPGIPGFGDNVIFDSSVGNENPTVTLNDYVTAADITYINSNVTFAGAYSITTNSMTVNSSQVKFVDHCYVNSALTFSGTTPRITQQSATSGRSFFFGNGGAFTLTGNSAANYFTGNTNAYYTFNTTSPLTVYFNPTTITAGALVVTKGLITLGNNISTNRLTLNALNSQELILGENATLNITASGTSNIVNTINAGVINASATGSKVLITSTAPTILATTGRIFKDATTINHLEMNSIGQTFIPAYPLTTKYLTLTEGGINNSTNNITIATAGKVTTTNGTTTSAVIAGLPGAPTNIVASVGNTSSSISFTTPEGDGGSAILDYTVTSSPDGLTATGSTTPIVINGLTNGIEYTFTVKANNNVGASAESLSSNSVTPSLGTLVVNTYNQNTNIYVNNNLLIIKYSSAVSANYSVKVLHLNGQIVKSENFNINAGTNGLEINIGKMASGVYLVALNDGIKSIITKRIIKN